MEWLQLLFSSTTSWLSDMINTRRREQWWSTCLAPPEWYNMNQRLLAYFTSRRSDRFWFIGSRVLRFICSPQNPLYSNSICTHKHYAATPQRFLTKQIFMNLQTAFCQKRKLKKKKVWLTEAALLQFTSRSNKAVITSELWKQEKKIQNVTWS